MHMQINGQSQNLVFPFMFMLCLRSKAMWVWQQQVQKCILWRGRAKKKTTDLWLLHFVRYLFLLFFKFSPRHATHSKQHVLNGVFRQPINGSMNTFEIAFSVTALSGLYKHTAHANPCTFFSLPVRLPHAQILALA